MQLTNQVVGCMSIRLRREDVLIERWRTAAVEQMAIAADCARHAAKARPSAISKRKTVAESAERCSKALYAVRRVHQPQGRASWRLNTMIDRLALSCERVHGKQPHSISVCEFNTQHATEANPVQVRRHGRSFRSHTHWTSRQLHLQPNIIVSSLRPR